MFWEIDQISLTKFVRVTIKIGRPPENFLLELVKPTVAPLSLAQCKDLQRSGLHGREQACLDSRHLQEVPKSYSLQQGPCLSVERMSLETC